jgi:hypothetical protein
VGTYRVVQLDFNALSGSIPEGITALASLSAFTVASNQLVGTLPALEVIELSRY